MTQLTWDTTADWDASQSQTNGILHDAVGDVADAGSVRLGHPVDYTDPAVQFYYHFDEAEGATTVEDLSGNGNTLTVNSATLGVPGLNGTTCASFNDPDSMEAPSNTSIQSVSGSGFTVGATITPSGLANDRNVYYAIEDSTLWGVNPGGRVDFAYMINGNWAWNNSGADIPIDEKSTMVHVYDQPDLITYVNGSEAGRYTLTNAPVDTTTKVLMIGNRATGNNSGFNGDIENLWGASRVYTAQEIADQYNGLTSGTVITGVKTS